MSAILYYQLEGVKNEKILTSPFVSIGRGERNNISLSDPLISRNRALLRSTAANKYCLMDTGRIKEGVEADRERLRETTETAREWVEGLAEARILAYPKHNKQEVIAYGQN